MAKFCKNPKAGRLQKLMTFQNLKIRLYYYGKRKSTLTEKEACQYINYFQKL